MTTAAIEPKPKERLEPASEAATSRTSDYPVRDETRMLVAVLFERALMIQGAREMRDADIRLAEEGTAAGFDSLPPA